MQEIAAESKAANFPFANLISVYFITSLQFMVSL